MELGNILQNLIYRDEMVYTTSGDYSFECGQDVVVCSEHGYPTGLDDGDGCQCEKMGYGFCVTFFGVELMRMSVSELCAESLVVSLFLGIKKFVEEYEGWCASE